MTKLKDKAEILLCIHAGAIERKKMRADFGITYDVDAMKLIDDLREWGIELRGVVITRFDGQPAAVQFKNKLQRRGIPVYTHRPTKGYPTDVDRIVSSEGYGANPYIETEKPLVVVTGPGPGSGKLATCLSQIYHDHLHGIHSGYAKFETFPIWNLPLMHPVNVAYEAATADLHDVNMIDPFHLEACGQTAINYNRDVEAFPVVHKILERITGAEPIYRSPTEMGVNRASAGIVNDDVVQAASRAEVIRRYFRYSSEYVMGLADEGTVQRVERLMEVLHIKPEDRKVVGPARRAAEEAQQQGKGNEGVYCGAAIELEGRQHRHGNELAADARGLRTGDQRGEATGGRARRDPLAGAEHHRVGGENEEGNPRPERGEPGPARDPLRPGHQRHRQSDGPVVRREAEATARLRRPHHARPHARATKSACAGSACI